MCMGLSKSDKTWLSQHFGENVVYDEPMHRHTSFHIGGPAEAFVKPQNLVALQTLIKWAGNNDIPCLIVGKGSNLLVKDKGIKGLVVSLEDGLNQMDHAHMAENKIRLRVMAGMGLQRVCRYARDNGFAGLNFAVGIPGSVGGAIRMNAGTADGCMADVIDTIMILDFSGEIKKIEKDHLDFSYRNFRITDPAYVRTDASFIILEAEMILNTADSGVLRADANTKLQQRKKTQPIHKFSPGCIFKNPTADLAAGRLIDEAGLKGTRIGDAEVSTQHANYIVNHGKATAADVIELMQMVGDRIYEKFRIRLEPEVIIVGE